MALAIRRVELRNYKSIATCDLVLGPFTALVGPNGAGKSNFLDALRFVRDALDVTLAHALRDRGGIHSVRRRSRGHPNHFRIALEVDLGNGQQAAYGFVVGAEHSGGFSVREEWCRIPGLLGREPEAAFQVARGEVRSATVPAPALEADRLALVAFSGTRAFRPLYDRLTRMGFYNLNPEKIRDLQDPDPGLILQRDGRNLAAVLREVARVPGAEPTAYQQIVEHLTRIVPGIEGVEPRAIGPKETLEFRQLVKGDEAPWRFLANEMSDGTLRALGLLVAAYQAARNGGAGVTLAGIEEPEMAVHPGAVEVLVDALRAASARTQVIITTHSPELLDHRAITDEAILAVRMVEGKTVIAPVDPLARRAMRDRLFTAGELLRQGQLEPDRAAFQASQQEPELPFASTPA